MPSEITHKTMFRPSRILGWLAVALGIGWLLGINGAGLNAGADAPVDRTGAPCQAVSVEPLR